jgi:predicted amidophosphoribosyltransferase
MPEHPRRDDIATTSPRPTPAGQTLCPVCWAPFTRVRRQRYCTDACRKTAWARRHADAANPTAELAVPPTTRRRDATIYTCPSCQTRYHGEQWCHDCNQPCTRVGLGGLCPHCDEPVALTDLLNLQQPPNR